MTRTESFQEAVQNATGYLVHKEETLWLREIAGSLAVIADSLQKAQTSQGCHECPNCDAKINESK